MAAITSFQPGGYPGRPYGSFAGRVAATTATITGTATAGITEADVVAGGRTIIITLANDTWVAGGSFDNTVKQAIINGLDSAQSEAGGWNNKVRDLEVVGAVVRTSDTIVTITLTASPTYDITATETITVTVPSTALTTSLLDVTGTPTFTVTAVAPPIPPSDVVDQASNWQANYWKRKSKKERDRDELLERIRLGILPPELREEADAAVKEAVQASIGYTAGDVDGANALGVAMQARQEYEDAYRQAYKDAYVQSVVDELWAEDLRIAKRRRAAAILLLLH